MKLSLVEIPSAIAQDLVKHLFNYDPETGILRWKNPPGTKVKKNAIAHTKIPGYYRVCVYGKKYKVHRIIWLYVHGYFPENEIDHIDRNGRNNKLSNLRTVSRQCNIRNSSISVTNKSGVTGVSFDKTNITWKASIRVDGKNYSLGSTRDYIEASCLRFAAEECLSWNKCNADSSAYQCIKSWLSRPNK